MGSPKPSSASCCHTPQPNAGGLKRLRRTVVLAAASGGALLLGKFWEPARPFGAMLGHYLSMIVWPVALGLVIGGMLERFVPHWYVERLMAGSRKRAIARSVVLGFFMSACCHGVLAVAVELYRKGASTASVIAFLLASPWANLPLTILLGGFFGWKSLYFVGGAVVIALVTGWIFQGFESRGWVERNPNTSQDPAGAHPEGIRAHVSMRFQNYRWSAEQAGSDVRAVLAGSLRLADMIVWWVLIGALAASAVAVFLPEHWMHRYLGPGIGGLFLTLAGASVLEVCSEGTAPLAFEIYRQTGAFGNAFVFLMAGVATDYTEIGLIWQTIGRRAAILLPLVTVPQILLLGYLANRLF